MDDHAMTPEDVATHLQLSIHTVRRMLSAGEFEGCAYKTTTGGVWRIDPELLREWRVKRVLSTGRIEPRSSRSRAAKARGRTL